MVHGVVPGSNAEQAGFLMGDVILSVNGDDVTSCPHEEALGVLAGQPAGQVTSLLWLKRPCLFSQLV
jgi:S1-C subfamily serine protease